jgi:hypothetical protein
VVDETTGTVHEDDSSAGRRPFHVGTHEEFSFENCRESKIRVVLCKTKGIQLFQTIDNFT